MLFQIYGCVSSGKIPTSETARLKGKYTQLDEINCFDQWPAVFKRKCLIWKIYYKETFAKWFDYIIVDVFCIRNSDWICITSKKEEMYVNHIYLCIQEQWDEMIFGANWQVAEPNS